MRNIIFAIVFILVIFFGFRYLQGWLTEPISEVNMSEKEKDTYLEELNQITGEGLQDTTMTTVKQCFEMANAYNIYGCLSTMITDDDLLSTSESIEEEAKGRAIYDLIGNNKPIIEMNFKRLPESTEEEGIYEVSFLLLQESKRPIYTFTVKEVEVVKVIKEDL